VEAASQFPALSHPAVLSFFDKIIKLAKHAKKKLKEYFAQEV